MKAMMKAFMLCPMCKKGHYISLTADQWLRLAEWRRGDGVIQEKMPELKPCEREFLKTGYCLNCQKILFGSADSELITER